MLKSTSRAWRVTARLATLSGGELGVAAGLATLSGGELGVPIVTETVSNQRQPYRGALKTAILDWSGTTADPHVIAPAVVFYNVFEKHGVPITMKEARQPMGLRKDLHIAKIMELPGVAERWAAVKGSKPTQSDVDTLFADFVPMQLECLPQYAGMCPGATEVCRILQQEFNLKLGSTTGFTRKMVNVLLARANQEGYYPDTTVAGDDVENNMGFRPAPFMVYKNLVQLGEAGYPIESVVKVDDTITGVGEGVTAGCWSVAVAGLSNYTDIDTIGQWESMSADEKQQRVKAAREKLYESNAHYVTDTIREVPWVVQHINERLARGETPQGSMDQVRLENESMESLTNPTIAL